MHATMGINARRLIHPSRKDALGYHRPTSDGIRCMMPTMSEDDCAICAKWPAALRPAMSQAIDSVSMKGWVCDDCVIAFWDNVWADAMVREAEKSRRRRKTD